MQLSCLRPFVRKTARTETELNRKRKCALNQQHRKFGVMRVH